MGESEKLAHDLISRNERVLAGFVAARLALSDSACLLLSLGLRSADPQLWPAEEPRRGQLAETKRRGKIIGPKARTQRRQRGKIGAPWTVL